MTLFYVYTFRLHQDGKALVLCIFTRVHCSVSSKSIFRFVSIELNRRRPHRGYNHSRLAAPPWNECLLAAATAGC